MVASRALASAGCAQCRTAVLKLFTTPATSAARPLASSALRNTTSRKSRRALSSSTLKSAESGEHRPEPRHLEDSSERQGVEELGHRQGQQEPESEQWKGEPEQWEDEPEQRELESEQWEPESEPRWEPLRSESQPDPQPDSQSEASDVPWYLRVEPPRHGTATEPPPLPQAPEGAPAILQPLIEYAAEEMGMDDLLVLDLRKLNPPPALGSNLIMMFATARSERHLHVSAGRLLRWLRAQRVYASADGMLGPNERKIKLKRKARRAKLMGTMGTDEADDGIATGWICVNLGNVNRGSEQSTVVSDDGRFAGFGVPQTGSTIVVQIMTESRRAELTLEDLWERKLARQIRDQADPDTSTSEDFYLLEETPKAEREASEAESQPVKAQSQPAAEAGRVGRVNETPGEFRWFSTMRPKPNQARGRWYSTVSSPRSSVGPAYDALLSGPDSISRALSQNGREKLRVLELLRIHLEGRPPAKALEVLHSATFQKLAELALRDLPAERTWAFRLDIETAARRTEHGGHLPFDRVRGLIQELRLHKMPATRAQYLQLVFCLFSPPHLEGDEQQALALELLQCVSLRGEPILANDIIVAIVEAISYSAPADPQALALQRRLLDLVLQAKLPCMDEDLLLRLLDAHARQGDWAGFWAAWRAPPQHLRPRSEAMYLHVYRRAAGTGAPDLAADALRRCFPEMLAERPAVRPVGRVREAILACIQVADPEALGDAKKLVPDGRPGPRQAAASREFVRLARVLQAVHA